MTDRRLVAIVVVGLVVVTLLTWWAKRPKTDDEKRAASAAAEARAVEEAQTNQSLDDMVSIMERSGILMRFNQFGSHAEAYLHPAAWEALTFDKKRAVGRALYRKAGDHSVYLFDGYSGKKLGRQGPRGLEID